METTIQIFWRKKTSDEGAKNECENVGVENHFSDELKIIIKSLWGICLIFRDA